MSCRCPEPGCLLETPPRWHATIYFSGFRYEIGKDTIRVYSQADTSHLFKLCGLDLAPSSCHGLCWMPESSIHIRFKVRLYVSLIMPCANTEVSLYCVYMIFNIKNIPVNDIIFHSTSILVYFNMSSKLTQSRLSLPVHPSR